MVLLVTRSLFHFAVLMVVSNNRVSFISSLAEAVKVPRGYHKITALRLKAYAIMYTIENFLFIRLTRNVSLLAIKIVRLSTQRYNEIQQNLLAQTESIKSKY